jgi:hypothetical protein
MITNPIKTLSLLWLLFAASLAHAENWYAVANDGDFSWGSTRNQASKAAAVNAAIRSCREVSSQNSSPQNRCKILDVGSASGYLAIAVSPTRIQVALNGDEGEATRVALAGCVAKTPESETCSIEFSKFNGVQPKASKVANIVQASGNCRPRTTTIRCQSHCINGDCVVTYENGCKLRVQVGSHYNALENRWEYDSPNC